MKTVHGRPTKVATTNVRIDANLFDEIKLMANQHRRSATQQVEWMLLQCIADNPELRLDASSARVRVSNA